MSDPMYAVELREVSKRYGSVTALNKITLQVKDGEFFSLLGPSGCGKTTSLRLIAGFEMADEGDVWIGGKKQDTVPAFKRPVNTVFQSYALFPHMSVFENVAFGLEMQHVLKADITRRVGEALEMVRLPGLGSRRPSQLSGGQQQRVALARALVNRPKVLLLDEPLGALDLKLRKAMQLELKALQERVGITFVYVTHDQEEAMTMSDRIAVMNHGLVLQVGTPDEIYERPSGRFVADFIGETNFLPGKLIASREGGTEVELKGGARVVGPPAQGVSNGQSVTLAIRPERLTLGSGIAEPGWNELEVRIAEIVYTGPSTSYLVRTPVGLELTVRSPNPDEGHVEDYRRGEQTNVRWRHSSGSLFTETAAETDL